MGFQRLRFIQFRNMDVQEISLGNAREIFLVGPNGQGKTNFLEGIYLLCYGSSFRTKNEKKIAQHGQAEFSARGNGFFADQNHEISVKFTLAKKDIILDGQAVRDRKDLVHTLPCIAFTHEDYLYVSGGPEHQRYFFDQSLSLFDVLYIDTLRLYRKALKVRNALLTQGGDVLTLEVYEQQLALAGMEICRLRAEAMELFNPLFRQLFSEISGLEEVCSIRYLPSWKDLNVDSILASLKSRRDQDRSLGFTATGPHRDRFQFMLGARNFSEHASTGQIRLISLILRIVQAQMAYQKTRKKPILLLDDVLLELDGQKRQKLLAKLPPFEQAFFTFLPEEPLELYSQDRPLYLRVEQGRYLSDDQFPRS